MAKAMLLGVSTPVTRIRLPASTPAGRGATAWSWLLTILLTESQASQGVTLPPA